jgi:hypothetical protein
MNQQWIDFVPKEAAPPARKKSEVVGIRPRRARTNPAATGMRSPRVRPHIVTKPCQARRFCAAARTNSTSHYPQSSNDIKN